MFEGGGLTYKVLKRKELKKKHALNLHLGSREAVEGFASSTDMCNVLEVLWQQRESTVVSAYPRAALLKAFQGSEWVSHGWWTHEGQEEGKRAGDKKGAASTRQLEIRRETRWQTRELLRTVAESEARVCVHRSGSGSKGC